MAKTVNGSLERERGTNEYFKYARENSAEDVQKSLENLRMSELLLKQEPSPHKDAKMALNSANADSFADSARDPHEDTVYSYFQISHPRKKNESQEVVSPISKSENQYKLKLSKQQTLVS